MRIFDLEGCEDDGVDIQIYLPGPQGPPGPAMVDVGTRLAPIAVTSAIAAPVNPVQRTFIVGVGPVVDPAIPDPDDETKAWVLWLFATSDVNTVELNDQSNIQLSGRWVGRNGSMLCLIWDGIETYVEGGRNEI